jgi:hypothetical protein
LVSAPLAVCLFDGKGVAGSLAWVGKGEKPDEVSDECFKQDGVCLFVRREFFTTLLEKRGDGSSCLSDLGEVLFEKDRSDEIGGE